MRYHSIEVACSATLGWILWCTRNITLITLKFLHAQAASPSPLLVLSTPCLYLQRLHEKQVVRFDLQTSSISLPFRVTACVCAPRWAHHRINLGFVLKSQPHEAWAISIYFSQAAASREHLDNRWGVVAEFFFRSNTVSIYCALWLNKINSPWSSA